MDQPYSFQNCSENLAQGPGAVNRNAPEGKRHLVKAAGVMGLMTMASRVLGMVRDIVCAKVFGTSWQWDAFVYAFSLPNFFRKLVGEGALASAFIPVYSELLQTKGEKEAFRFANVLISLLSVCFLLFLIIVEVALAVLMKVEAFPERIHLVFDFLRFFFPYLTLMSFYAVGMGILNCHRHFFASSLGPLVLNLCWIGGTVWVLFLSGSDMPGRLRLLALIILFSGVLQDLVQVPQLHKLGFRMEWLWEPFYPGIKKAVRLILPVILGFSVMQVNMLVDATFAFWIGPGANSTLWYGNRLMQLPLGVFAVAMGMALLPTISNQVSSGQFEQARKNLAFSLRCVALITLPCAAGLMTLAKPIVRLLYERGQFDSLSTQRTAAVLVFYALGLFAYAAQKILTPAFHSLQNTKTPVKISLVCMVSNIVFNLLFMGSMKEAGLALSTTLSGIIQFALLCFSLHRGVLRLPLNEIFESLVRILLATFAMSITAFWAHHFLEGRFPQPGMTADGIRVLGSISLAALLYPGYCYLLGVTEIRDAWGWILKRCFSKQGRGTV